MILDIVGDQLELSFQSDELQPRHRSQLIVWNFEKQSDTCYTTPFNQIDQLTQILEFLNKIEGIDLAIGDQARFILNSNLKRREYFNSIKQVAKEYKDGNLGKKSIKEYQ